MQGSRYSQSLENKNLISAQRCERVDGNGTKVAGSWLMEKGGMTQEGWISAPIFL